VVPLRRKKKKGKGGESLGMTMYVAHGGKKKKKGGFKVTFAAGILRLLKGKGEGQKVQRKCLPKEKKKKRDPGIIVCVEWRIGG